MVSSSMSFSSVLLVAVELAEVLLPSRGFTSSSVRQSTSRSPSDSSYTMWGPPGVSREDNQPPPPQKQLQGLG